jgi:hypothetical protein
VLVGDYRGDTVFEFHSCARKEIDPSTSAISPGNDSKGSKEPDTATTAAKNFGNSEATITTAACAKKERFCLNEKTVSKLFPRLCEEGTTKQSGL